MTAPARVAQAILSLENSRRALRDQLMPAPLVHHGARGSGAWARLWRQRLRNWPAAQLAREALHQWWQRQAWQPVAREAADQARAHLWPVVRRHPWWAVGAAAAVGATVTSLRPWRWPSLRHHARQAPAVASRWLWTALRAAPAQALILGLASLLLRPASSHAPADPAPAAPPAPRPDRVREPDSQPPPPVRDPAPQPRAAA